MCAAKRRPENGKLEKILLWNHITNYLHVRNTRQRVESNCIDKTKHERNSIHLYERWVIGLRVTGELDSTLKRREQACHTSLLVSDDSDKCWLRALSDSIIMPWWWWWKNLVCFSWHSCTHYFTACCLLLLDVKRWAIIKSVIFTLSLSPPHHVWVVIWCGKFLDFQPHSHSLALFSRTLSPLTRRRKSIERIEFPLFTWMSKQMHNQS